MSNKKKRRKLLKGLGEQVRLQPAPRICEACQRGEHPGYEHTADGMPIITPADIQRLRAGLS
jgi:hypothetical protein